MANANKTPAPLGAEVDAALLRGLTGEPQPAQYGDIADADISDVFRDDVGI